MNTADWKFQLGQCLKTADGNDDVIIKSILRDDPSGPIYEVTRGANSAALKMYTSANSTAEKHASIKDLIESGSPAPSFLWPVEMLQIQGAGLGYLMPVPDPSFRSFEHHRPLITSADFRATILCCVNLALSFTHLHSLGYCFNSIELKNFFYDPYTSKIEIMENDNVVIDESAKEVVSKPSRYLAPEIIQERSVPTVRTDLHLLAALLFYKLFKSHPLEGAATEAAKNLGNPTGRRELYGDKALFIFHPQSNQNAPVPGKQDETIRLWGICPQFLKDLFITIFTQGLKDSTSRLSAKAWSHVLMRLHNSLFTCQQCGKPNFYGGPYKDANALPPSTCWACKTPLNLPTRLRIGKLVVMLNPDTQLYPYHTQSPTLFKFTAPTASMTHLPSDPRHFGLRNDSTTPWMCDDGQGNLQSYSPGQICPLHHKGSIDFGMQKGSVQR